MQEKKINIGCGQTFHPDWINVDFHSNRLDIIEADVRKKLPFDNEQFDAVYHSHLLEHLGREDGERFILECCRILKVEGVIRVVVPDFGDIVNEYLGLREQMERQQNADTYAQYNWLITELADQFSRNITGGEMAHYFSQQHDDRLQEYLFRRVGLKKREAGHIQEQDHDSHIRKFDLNSLMRKFHPHNLREHLFKIMLGQDDFESLQIGRFRKSGEIHRWLYDQYSLGYLLEQCGFRQVRIHTAESSSIQAWSSYQLDIDSDGHPRKPSSLYMEAIK